MALKERISGRVQEIRQRRPLLDHLVRTVEHYGAVKGSLQAGAVTYFAFLSFFPILGLAFAIVGFIARGPMAEAQEDLVEAITSVLPGIVSADPNDTEALQISDIQDSAPSILSIALPVLLYSGLGWLSAMREALVVVFEEPRAELPNFVMGKLRDLISLASIGLTLVVAVAVAGLVRGFSRQILELVGLADSVAAEALLWALAVVVGLGANALLFFALFRLLATPNVPTRSLWSGALLGAIGFEGLKQLSGFLLASTQNSPATQSFGIALILLVWINYFSRVVMLAASWAHTSPAARAAREEALRAAQAADEQPHGPAVGPAVVGGAGRRTVEPLTPAASFAVGAASTLGAVAAVRRLVRKKDT